jgi:hypothetical protein
MTTTIIEPIDFLKNYCTFDNPNEVWMLKGISRSKDNEEGFDRFMRRLVVAKPEDIEDCYNDIRRMGNKTGTKYRIYVSLNSRDVVKGLFNFQKKLLEIGYGLARGLDDHLQMSKKVSSLWKTELEQRSNRGTKHFLIDIDDVSLYEDVRDFVEGMPTTIRAIRKTVSGYAIVIDACDIRGLQGEFAGKEIDIQKDSMVFVERWEGQE